MRNKPLSGNNGHHDASTLEPSMSKVGIKLRLKLKEAPVFGQDVQLIALLKNLTSLPKQINMNINVQAIENNGLHRNVVCQKSDSVQLKANSGRF